MKRRTFLTAIGGAAATSALAACGGSSNPLASASGSASAGGGSAASGSIVVASANFPESEVLANIYAGALKAKGVSVSTKLDIADRETYVPALEKGEINLIPEYTGNLARYLDKQAVITDAATALASLKKALPGSLTALTPSAAEDTDSIVVTQETASKYNLTSISDLTGHASDMVLGAPAEFKSRVDGVDGLKRVYGLTFKEFRGFTAAGTLTVQALKNGQVQAANLFSTDPNVAANKFVVLKDPKHLFGAQNIVPVMTADKVTDQIKAALDAVSAKLTTDSVTQLVAKVALDKQDASTVAQQWLKDNNLG